MGSVNSEGIGEERNCSAPVGNSPQLCWAIPEANQYSFKGATMEDAYHVCLMKVSTLTLGSMARAAPCDSGAWGRNSTPAQNNRILQVRRACKENERNEEDSYTSWATSTWLGWMQSTGTMSQPARGGYLTISREGQARVHLLCDIYQAGKAFDAYWEHTLL